MHSFIFPVQHTLSLTTQWWSMCIFHAQFHVPCPTSTLSYFTALEEVFDILHALFTFPVQHTFSLTTQCWGMWYPLRTVSYSLSNIHSLATQWWSMCIFHAQFHIPCPTFTLFYYTVIPSVVFDSIKIKIAIRLHPINYCVLHMIDCRRC